MKNTLLSLILVSSLVCCSTVPYINLSVEYKSSKVIINSKLELNNLSYFDKVIIGWTSSTHINLIEKHFGFDPKKLKFDFYTKLIKNTFELYLGWELN